MELTFLIVEDHPITAMGIKILIQENFDNQKVEVCADGNKALSFIKNNTPDIVILDIVLPNVDTQALLANILREKSDTRVLVYSNNDENIYAMSYIDMGAFAYLNKSSSNKEFITAINLVLDGKIYLSHEVYKNNLVSKTRNKQKGIKNLSSRELEVFTHLLQGDRIKDISGTMNIHQSTASTLKKRVMKKLGAKTLIDLKNIADNG